MSGEEEHVGGERDGGLGTPPHLPNIALVLRN